MTNVVIKDLIFDKEQLKTLYLDNKWYAYTNKLDNLYNGILNSTTSLGAYKDNQLIGLIRVISDGYTVCHIQDILILEEYHRAGIGTLLMNPILEQYKQCRQIILLTDNSEKTKKFYEKLGFEIHDPEQTVGFQYNK